LNLLDTAEAEHAEQVETTDDAAHKWTQHVQEIAEATLFPRADSWYVGANIAGKPRQFMLYVRGLGNYTAVCEEEEANGYPGFVRNGHCPPGVPAHPRMEQAGMPSPVSAQLGVLVHRVGARFLRNPCGRAQQHRHAALVD